MCRAQVPRTLAPQADAVAYVHDVRRCTLCGVEIIDGAEAVTTQPFRTPRPRPNPRPNPNPKP